MAQAVVLTGLVVVILWRALCAFIKRMDEVDRAGR
jgi:hypothetical protein